MPYEYLQTLLRPNKSKIVLLVLDGLGGLPIKPGGPTELEAARTPTMDRLASEGSLGRSIPIRPGITPGSGPAHLALFGYDPIKYAVGRGALEAAGVGLKVYPGDVAARGNFCTLDDDGKIIDRRAGRISSEDARPAIEKLQSVEIHDVSMEVRQVKEYRFAVVMRGKNLAPNLEDTDPQETGLKPFPVSANDSNSQTTADLYQKWVDEARQVLADQPKANGVTLRGFATDPKLPQFKDAFGLRAACIAVYPMYRGVSTLVGMDVIDFCGDKPEEEFAAVQGCWDDYDFFFIHIKKTDSMGEDGNFPGKAEIIESVDASLPNLMNLEPDVLMITGDHSTPALLRSHSWHPVPFLLWAPQTHLRDEQIAFGERACKHGQLGTFLAQEAVSLALAHSLRLEKYGA